MVEDGQELGLAFADVDLESIDDQLPESPEKLDDLPLDVDDKDVPEPDAEKAVFGDESEPEPSDDQDENEGEPETKTGVSPQLLQTAATLGIPTHMAEAYGSDDALQAAMNPLIAQRSRVGVQAAPPTQVVTPGKEPAAGYKLELPKLNPEEFEGDTVEHFNKLNSQITAMNEHYAQMAEQQQNVIGQLVLQGQKSVVELERGQLDSYVATLGENWKDLLGEGASSNLNPSSAHFRNRETIFLERRQREAQFRTLGMAPPPMEELFKQSLHMAFHSRVAEIARKEHGVKVAKHKKTATARPTSRRSPATKSKHPLDAATQAAKSAGQKIGLYPSLP